MVKFITLTGELTGSARLNMQYNRHELYLRLRTRRNVHLRAFVTDGSKVREVTLSGNSGAFESMAVRGLILTDEYGNILSTGSGDMCAKELENFKIGIRMLISAKSNAEKQHTAQTARTAQNTHAPNQKDNIKRSAVSDLPDSYTSNQRDNPLGNRVQPSAKTNQLPNANPEGASMQNTDGQSQIKPTAKASAIQYDAGQAKQNAEGQSKKNASCTAHSEKAQGKTTGIRRNKNQNTSIMHSIEGHLTPEALEKPQSPATLEILNQAGYLFHGERVKNSEQLSRQKRNNTEINDMSDSAFTGVEVNPSECNNCKRETMPLMREAVRNPFPNFFDNSYWWRNEGDTKRIYGTANVRGIKYNVTAIRSNAKYPPNGIGRSVRRMYSSDGKRFWVGLTKV